MPSVELRVLGSPTVVVDGAPEALPAVVPASLLAYLAVARDWVPRAELAYLYRPDEPEAVALPYLRLQLHRAQRLPWAAGLQVDAQRVRWDVASDVARFEAALAEGDLGAACAAYGGALLEGYALRGRPAFDAWLDLERGALQERYRGALERRADDLSLRDAHDDAVEVLERLVALDDLDEAAVAALVAALARAGRLGEARRRYEAFEAHLRREVGAEPAASTRAALEEPPARPRRAPAPGSTEAGGHPGPPLPEPPTRFVGRDRELAELDALLDRDGARLVTLVGLGGAGKTRLALEVARRRTGRYRDGVRFVPLAAVGDGAQLLERVAEALGVDVGAGAAAVRQVREALAEHDVLVVLDEFEGLAEHAPVVGEMLAGDGLGRVLVTSRRRLALSGEVVVDVDGLRTDAGAPGASSEAVALFVGAARRVAPRLELGPDALAAAGRVARAVQGVPLALELAATWVRAMPVAAVADELEVGLHLLETDLVDLPERHRSLRAVLERTWADLDATERAALARLSVLVGGGTLAAAEAVAGAHRALLLGLLNRSLLQRLGPDRFASHPLVAQFAAEALAADPDLDAAARDAHAAHYAGRLHDVGEAPTVGASEALLALAPDLANLERAWLRLLEAGRYARALEVARPLFDFYDLHGHYRQGGELCDASLARLAGARGALVEALRATVEGAAATTARERGDLTAARAHAESAEASAARAGRSDLAGRAQRCLGDVLQMQGEFEAAEAVYLRAIAAFEAIGDEGDLANVLNSLGSMEAMQERFEAAEARFLRCVVLFERVGDELSRATALNNLGYLADVRGELDEAARRYERALEVYERLAYPRGVSSVKNNLLVLYGQLGRLDEAEAMGRASLEVKEAVGDVLGQIVTLKNLGDLQVRRGTPERADAFLRPALRIARDAEALPRLLQVLVAFVPALDATDRRALADAAAEAVWRHPVAPPSVRERARALRPALPDDPAPDPSALDPIVTRLLLDG